MDLQSRGRDEASTEPGHGGNSPTRQVKRTPSDSAPAPVSSGAITDPAPPTTKGSVGVGLSGEALAKEGLERMRITMRMLMTASIGAIALTLLMGGDPFAKKVCIFGLSWSVITTFVMLRKAYTPATYDHDFVGWGSLALAVPMACILYYFGVFSPAAMVSSLGLYIFCLGGGARWSVAIYSALAGVHLALAMLVMTGTMVDRGLVRAANISVGDQISTQVWAQAIYIIALVAGRMSRRALEVVFGELESAARRIAQREALLNEAKRELERAAWVGGEGRFTEQVIGSFRLGNIIGRGGMGEVYEATHIETHEEAAVKLLQRNVFADPHTLARFAREAKAAAALNSPYVVRVLEVPSEDSPLPYLAMERLRGEDLASMLRRERRLSTRELIKLAQQVGRGIDAARAVGVVHRDIKPQNLFLTRRENASSLWKVLDFGVSKLVGQGSLTRDQLVGTPEYMPPEQAAGKEVDYRSDLYGLAAVLYRCIASRAPFVDDSLPALVHKVIHGMPPRPSHSARVSADVELFLAIGLAKDPNERFQSGAEFAEVLELAIEEQLPAALRERAQRILERTPWTE